MQIWTPLVALAGLVAVAEGACSGPNTRITPPAGAIVVDASGAHVGSVRTVAEGFAKLPNTTAEHTVFVFPGVYQEQATLPVLNGPVVLQGYTCDTSSYAANQVTITQAKAQKGKRTDPEYTKQNPEYTYPIRQGLGKGKNITST
ncbi:hypothetical protein PF008_g29767 [Phytophthora fragariae]|uniref:Pectinesterase n=1 Tax=Phytophthora fragariae TaxID=53985 RepID=A0A6G0Q7Z5_9STRA|nr:hypothetical protein PF008_g29767 [Phytophthora fragariae]